MKTLVFMLLLAIANAKVYSRCELAKVLKEKRVDGYLGNSLADWVCLAQHESNFNTQATNENSNGSTDYGIFQINNKWWCSDGVFQRNGCGIPCSELLTDDISNAVLCAKKIERVQGLTAWVAWRKYCQGKDLSSYVAGCEV